MMQALHVHLKLPHVYTCVFVLYWNVQLEMQALVDWSIVLPCNEICDDTRGVHF